MKYLKKFSAYDKLLKRRRIFKNKMKREYTNKRINKAGEMLKKYSLDNEFIKEDIDIINSWREAHSLALEELVSLTKKRVKQVGGQMTVVSRLKKLESIKLKLELAENMQLSRMQDIGGCRVIVEDTKKIFHILNRIQKFHGGFELTKIDDYIQKPKDSGYRGVHFTFQANTKKDEYKILLELQFRTRLQHAWATAVEIAGLFNKASFKSNQSNGKDEWLEFFKMVSYLFAYEEFIGMPNEEKVVQLANNIKRFEKMYSFIRRLKSYNITYNLMNKNESDKEYFLLELNLSNGLLNVYPFSKEKLEVAQAQYFYIESMNNPVINAVLVSASTFKSIENGYLNYFANSAYFIKEYTRIIRKYTR